MEHDQATRMQAAERYLLGELSDAERDEFEEHFFDCAACAEDVQAGVVFEANARAVLADQARSVKMGWWEWLCFRPAFAAPVGALLTLLLGGFGYEAYVTRGQRTQLAELQMPQPYPLFFLQSTTRGAGQVIEVPRESRFFGLSLDVPPGQSFRHYKGEVLSESGAILFTVPLANPRTPGESLNLLIPTSRLEPGRPYTLVVRGLEGDASGKPGIEIARHQFKIQRN